MNRTKPIKSLSAIREIRKIIRYRCYHKHYLLFALGLNLPIHYSDLLALRGKSILHNPQRRFRQNIIFTEGTTGEEHELVLNDAAIEAIRWYYKYNTRKLVAGYLFYSYRNKPTKKHISRMQASNLIAKWCKAVGLKGHYGVSSLQKTWGYHAYQQGYDLGNIAKILGRDKIGSTYEYLDLERRDTDERDIYLQCRL